MRLKQVILALFIVRFCVNISLSLLRFGIMVVREKNCYYAIALTDFFVFLSCAEMINTKLETMLDFLTMAGILLLIASPFIYFHKMKNIKKKKLK